MGEFDKSYIRTIYKGFGDDVSSNSYNKQDILNNYLEFERRQALKQEFSNFKYLTFRIL